MLPIVGSQRALAATMAAGMPKYFTRDEVGAILTEELRARDHASWFLVSLLWGTGARVSEAVGITVGDLDLMGRAVRIRTLKRAGHVRAVPLKPGLVGECAVWVGERGLRRGDRLFRFNRNTAWARVRRACEAAFPGDPRNHPHAFRHSFAVNCVTQGVPVTVLREWLGHRDITKTLIYTRVLASDSRVFMDGVEF
jgi:integrase/recombinase XerD